jgi:hypothetical protein
VNIYNYTGVAVSCLLLFFWVELANEKKDRTWLMSTVMGVFWPFAMLLLATIFLSRVMDKVHGDK